MPDARVIPFDGDDRGRRPGAGQAGPVPLDAEVFDFEEYAEEPPSLSERAVSALDFLRRRITGEYAVDDFGFDPELTDRVLLAPLRPLYSSYFRVETRGLENVPDTGGALVVGNHSGTIALDGTMTQLALLDHHPAHRHLRMLGANLLFSTPFLGELVRRAAARWPAPPTPSGCCAAASWSACGRRGSGHRQTVQRALQAAAVRPRRVRGGRASHRDPDRAVRDRRCRGDLPDHRQRQVRRPHPGPAVLPHHPTFPWLGPLGMVPLPSKWIIEFGEPISTAEYGPEAADDPMLVFNLTDQVRENIQQSLYRLLVQRRSVFR